jgi:two-component system, chemotaxis family, sensor kinase CheA
MSIAFFDRLLHPSLRAGDPEQLRQARTTAAFVATAGVVAPMMLPVLIAVGDVTAVWSCAVETIAVALPLICLRVLARRELAAHLFLLVLVTSLLPPTVTQGGIHGSAVDWYAVVPLVATLILPRRGALLWLLATLAIIGTFGTLALVGIDLPTHVDGEGADVRLVASEFLKPVIVFLLAGAFEANKSRMAAELVSAHASVENARHDAQRVLDTVDQGLFTITDDGRVGAGISAAAVRWFGAPAPDVSAWAWLRDTDADAAQWLELGWEAHHEGFLPVELTLAQLPQRVEKGERTHALRWLATERAGELLAVVTDITEVLQVERAGQAQRELVAILIRLVRDRQGMAAFLDEADAQVRALASGGEGDFAGDARRIHTLKGNAGMFGLDGFAAHCHEVETSIVEHVGVLRAAERRSLVDHWHELRERIDPFLGRDVRGLLQIARIEVERLLDAVVEGRPRTEIEAQLRRWTFEDTRGRLDRAAEQARALALRLHKGAITVHVEGHGIALSPTAWAPFWSALSHAIRNAVDHGLELPADRVLAGKPGNGQLWFSTVFDAGELVITIRDDGRGIDWHTLAERARASGLPCTTSEDLAHALLADGVTTASAVTPISGRGVGMAALDEATMRLGGRIEIRSATGGGTTFEFRFPASSAGGDTTPLAQAA